MKEKCTYCEAESKHKWKNEIPCCKKHYIQLYRHGKILERTIYDRNEWEVKNGYAYCKTYDKNFNENAIVKMNIDVAEQIKNKKIYIRYSNGKPYAVICAENGRKILLHRYVMGIHNEEYSIRRVIDHINGDTLDNRRENLRICWQSDNMKNIHKNGSIVGVTISNYGKKYISRIMHNYRTVNLGKYDTIEEAVYARIVEEEKLCGEYGPNKDIYYILKSASPLEEIKKYLEKNNIAYA